MRYLLLNIAFFFTLTSLADSHDPSLDIDKNRVTVSGISSGALMAHQLHIAYSDVFSGAAIISGGPYNCAENSLMTALKRCTENDESPLPVDQFTAQIKAGAKAGTLADPANLADDRVFMFHGTQDTKVSSLVHDSTAALYAGFIPADQIQQVNNVAAGHVFPAMDAANNCTDLVAPFVGDCDYDGAGELLSHLYPGLQAPDNETLTELREVSLPGAADAELMETAFLYVPADCDKGASACALHLVLHGCAQSADTIGTDFIRQSGYLPWAEANEIVLAFPQVEKSLVAPINPHACWDWWGYTGDAYANRNGKQMVVVTDWIKSLSK
ncbi:MAG: polyhydroxybutyrate depolymerase [Xanthomonadales bacterium]|nr:polyhydroxybutyrate depolymerase [Gammaproteobacteria bacterium]NNK03319.1 polyhydroxybutyrate depolymerase [Xanthomonadales bacterium]